MVRKSLYEEEMKQGEKDLILGCYEALYKAIMVARPKDTPKKTKRNLVRIKGKDRKDYYKNYYHIIVKKDEVKMQKRRELAREYKTIK